MAAYEWLSTHSHVWGFAIVFLAVILNWRMFGWRRPSTAEGLISGGEVLFASFKLPASGQSGGQLLGGLALFLISLEAAENVFFGLRPLPPPVAPKPP